MSKASRPLSAATSVTSDNGDNYDSDNEGEEEFTEYFAEETISSSRVGIDDRLPSISPRDRLSYVEDKRAWKESTKFQAQRGRELERLLVRMQIEILRAKPRDVVLFLATEFFADHRQIALRKEITK